MLLYSKSLILACSQCSLETKPGFSVVDDLSVCYHMCSGLRNRAGHLLTSVEEPGKLVFYQRC